jgi:hypothetical protein
MRWVRFLILPVALLSACYADFKNELDKVGSVNWNPELGLPIVRGLFTIEDYVNAVSDELIVSQDSSGVVVFEYTGPEISSDRAETMINLRDQVFNTSIGFSLGESSQLPIAGTLTKSSNFEFVVDTEGGDLLDSMLLKNGSFNINISGNYPTSGEIEIIINPLSIGGNIYQQVYNWTYDPASPNQSFQETVDLNDARLDYTNGNTTTNSFAIDVNLTLFYEGQTITPNNLIDLSFTMNNTMFKVAYGKFGQRQFETPVESVLLGIFDSIEVDSFYLDNPQLNISFKNSFGLPVVARLSALIAVNSNGDALDFAGSIIDNPITVSRPTIGEEGKFAETNVAIDRNNSNIADIISFLPAELLYHFDGSIDSQRSQIEQFVVDSSRVIGTYTVKLPLSGLISNFTTSKEYSFNGEDLDLLKKTKVILFTSNGLPLTVGTELIFLDANDIPLDTLFAGENILEPGITDSNGAVISPTENSVEALLSEAEMEVLKKSKKIVLLTWLNTGTTGTENVKIKMEDQVKVNVFIQTSLSF